MTTQTISESTVTRRLSAGAAVFDVSHFGRLRISGADAIDLLNRLTTNDLEKLRPGMGMGAALTTNKGRIIDLLRVLRRGEDLLALTSPDVQDRVSEWIDFYTFSEDVAVADVTPDTKQYLIVGSNASDELARSGYCVDALGEADLSHATESEGDGEYTLARTSFGELPAFELVVSGSRAPAQIAAETLGQTELARLRIEQGTPAYPDELNERRNPLEANLKPYVSFNKGCYIGQEVVARLDTYDRVQRFLCQLSVRGDTEVEPGSAVIVDGNEVGEVTSSAPGLALAYLRKRFYEDGAAVEVASGGGLVSAKVRDIRPPAYFE